MLVSRSFENTWEKGWDELTLIMPFCKPTIPKCYPMAVIGPAEPLFGDQDQDGGSSGGKTKTKRRLAESSRHERRLWSRSLSPNADNSYVPHRGAWSVKVRALDWTPVLQLTRELNASDGRPISHDVLRQYLNTGSNCERFTDGTACGTPASRRLTGEAAGEAAAPAAPQTCGDPDESVNANQKAGGIQDIIFSLLNAAGFGPPPCPDISTLMGNADMMQKAKSWFPGLATDIGGMPDVGSIKAIKANVGIGVKTLSAHIGTASVNAINAQFTVGDIGGRQKDGKVVGLAPPELAAGCTEKNERPAPGTAEATKLQHEESTGPGYTCARWGRQDTQADGRCMVADVYDLLNGALIMKVSPQPERPAWDPRPPGILIEIFPGLYISGYFQILMGMRVGIEGRFCMRQLKFGVRLVPMMFLRVFVRLAAEVIRIVRGGIEADMTLINMGLMPEMFIRLRSGFAIGGGLFLRISPFAFRVSAFVDLVFIKFCKAGFIKVPCGIGWKRHLDFVFVEFAMPVRDYKIFYIDSGSGDSTPPTVGNANLKQINATHAQIDFPGWIEEESAISEFAIQIAPPNEGGNIGPDMKKGVILYVRQGESSKLVAPLLGNVTHNKFYRACITCWNTAGLSSFNCSTPLAWDLVAPQILTFEMLDPVTNEFRAPKNCKRGLSIKSPYLNTWWNCTDRMYTASPINYATRMGVRFVMKDDHNPDHGEFAAIKRVRWCVRRETERCPAPLYGLCSAI